MLLCLTVVIVFFSLFLYYYYFTNILFMYIVQTKPVKFCTPDVWLL